MLSKYYPKLYRIGLRFPVVVIGLCLVLTLLSLHAVSKLQIKNDLTSLLPQKIESVKGLEELKENFGGLAHLFVTVEAKDAKTAERFAGQFSQAIETHPSIQYVDYKRPVDYFEKRKWLYLDHDDLHEVKRRVERSLELEQKGVSTVFNDLMDFGDVEDRPDLEFTDIREKYKKRYGFEIRERISAEEGKFLLIRVKLKENPQNFAATKKIMSDLRERETEVRTAGLFPDVSVGYTGGYQKSLEQTELIKKEIAWVSAIVSFLLLAILLFYFGRISSALLIGLPVGMAVIWTGGLVYLLIGHLNIITSFGAAILAGLGSDYGIYLLTRYYEERKKGLDLLTSCRLAFSDTGKATYLSMITTVGAFLALLCSDFRLFIEFGVVGTVGLILNFIAMMLVLPAGLTLLERWQKHHIGKVPLLENLLFQKTASYFWTGIHSLLTPSRTVYGILIVLILCGLAAFSIPKQTQIHFNDGQIESRKLPSYHLSDRIGQLFPVHLNPTVLMIKGPNEEEKTVRKLESIINDDEKGRLTFNNVLGLTSFIPTDQNEKKQILKKIRGKVASLQKMLENKKETLIKSLNNSIRTGWISKKDLPTEVRRMFESKQNNGVYAVYLYPSFGRDSTESMKRYHEGVMTLKTKYGLRFTAADGTFVGNDIIRLIEKEASRGIILLLAFLAIIITMTVSPFKKAVLIFSNLFGSLIILSGILWLFKIQLNVINIAVIPIILGTGIDCFIHFSQRYHKNRNLPETLQTKIPPIFVSNLTTIVGFGGLLLTSSAGLRSAGWVAVIGLAIVTFFCIFVFPRCLSLKWISQLETAPNIETEVADV